MVHINSKSVHAACKNTSIMEEGVVLIHHTDRNITTTIVVERIMFGNRAQECQEVNISEVV